MSYATQTVRVIKNDKKLHDISACRPIRHRGDILDGGSLDIVFTAPRKNIIRVQVTHFAGTPRKDPKFTTYEEDVTPEIREDDDYAYFTSGDLTARVSKGGNWSVDYMVGDRVLTTSGWRGMGRALKKDGTPCSLLPHGTSCMSEEPPAGRGRMRLWFGRTLRRVRQERSDGRYVERGRRHGVGAGVQEHPVLHDQPRLRRAGGERKRRVL